MSFETYEESVEGGRPVELYEFSYLGQTQRYCSWDRSVSVNLVAYTSAIISRTEVEDSGKNVASANMTLTCEPNFPPALLFSVCPPSDVVNLLIKRVQANDLTDPHVIWAGRVINVAWPGDKAKMTCQSLFTRLKQPGLRRLYGKNCPHLLYSQGSAQCRVNPASFMVTTVIGGAEGLSVQSADFAAFPDQYFRGGKIQVEISPGVFEKRGIQSHVGDTLTITHPLPGLEGEMTVEAFPGCDKTIQTCHSKFDNVVNFGGFPYIPLKNPFGSSSVF